MSHLPSKPAHACRTLSATHESWPLSRPFVIARGVKTEAHVVVVRVSAGAATGRGEAVPYARYGESVEGVLATIARADPSWDRNSLLRHMLPGAARNALDCALWDLAAKQRLASAAAIAGSPSVLTPVRTAYTLSLGSPEEMAAQALAVPRLALLKLKLGGAGDPARMAAVRAARPEAQLVADANESWTPDMLEPFLAAAAGANVALIEQPLPAGSDDALASIPHLVPLCADESVHTSADLYAAGPATPFCQRYDAVNIKLDKAGGLTEALNLHRAARAEGLKIMVGCMVATSLAMAPALILAQDADWVDLDGPLLLARDREPALTISAEGWIDPPEPALWG